METENIQRSEHEEFARRIKEENDRQNHRLAVLEENTRRLEKLNVSIGPFPVSWTINKKSKCISDRYRNKNMPLPYGAFAMRDRCPDNANIPHTNCAQN